MRSTDAMETVKIKQKARIIEKELLAPDIHRMSFETELCDEAIPGQFILVYPPDNSKLLGRPILLTFFYFCSLIFKIK